MGVEKLSTGHAVLVAKECWIGLWDRETGIIIIIIIGLIVILISLIISLISLILILVSLIRLIIE